MMERRPPGESKLIVPTQTEQAKFATPGYDPSVIALAKEFFGTQKPEHRGVPLKTNLRAFERKEGAPGARSRTKRTKPSRGRSRGRSAWMATAKAKHKADRRED